ncbi:MAG: hypothetical protein UT48_C0014G0009 [Parcubacteria group bacterium GW2011_GWE2_39_37]|uniref:Uncharacterized protein n=1 Tax=Candidatus Falkowbacteria bacterium GW2011_GWF2_39_8 TaxID=1618642 RepID=A0A0G0PXI2_9BACT|nr:MAG: hypothetical protein UT48_C0014G0009 [Parcubacteria group bacterium GW2011_GWE2_39_37]KKR32588.1 MAG: hypothetical protein UT64_C0028G0004 [Candidatus Falkowbacteria bacterium GW2011_GWF2_39_8]
MLTFKKLDKKKLLLYSLIILTMISGMVILLYRYGLVGNTHSNVFKKQESPTVRNVQINNINTANFKIFENPSFKALKETVVEQKNFMVGNKDPFNSKIDNK